MLGAVLDILPAGAAQEGKQRCDAFFLAVVLLVCAWTGCRNHDFEKRRAWTRRFRFLRFCSLPARRTGQCLYVCCSKLIWDEQ
jgi:hypothetical protein